MKKLTAYFPIFALTILFAGCTQQTALNDTDDSLAAIPSVSPVLAQKKTEQLNGYTFKLSAIANSGREGWVTIEAGGEFGLEVRIKYLDNKIASSSSEPVMISAGKCPSPSNTALHKLQPVLDGESRSIISSSLEELSKRIPLAVSVRQSITKPNTLLACGNVELNEGARMRYDQTLRESQ